MANLASAMTPSMETTQRVYDKETNLPDSRNSHSRVSRFSTVLYHHLGVETPFDPQHRYVTSYILPVPLFALFRTAVAIYMLVTVLSTAVQEGVGSISYFTNLSYWGCTTYFVMSTVHTCSFAYAQWRWSRARKSSANGRIEMLEKAYPLDGVGRIDVARDNADIEAVCGDSTSGTTRHDRIETLLTYSKRTELEIGSTYPRSLLSRSFPRPLQFAHSLLISTVASYPLVVTVIFWTLLAGPDPLGTPYTAFVNISKHTINVALTQLDLTILSRTPMMPWWHLVPVISFLGMYIGIVAITYHRYHVLVYGFFNTQQFGVPLVVVFCILLVVFTIASFLISQLFFFTREFIAAKIQGSGGWGSAKAMSVDDDACIPTRRGPGPLGGGGRRRRESSLLRGRFPANAVSNRRASRMTVESLAAHRLPDALEAAPFDVTYRHSTSASPTNIAFEQVEMPSSRSKLDLLCETYTRSTQNLNKNPDVNASSSSLYQGVAV